MICGWLSLVLTSPMFSDAASKVAAEHAAWDFIKEKAPLFTLNTILPDLVIGEVLNTASVSAGSTAGMVQSAYKGDPSMLMMVCQFNSDHPERI